MLVHFIVNNNILEIIIIFTIIIFMIIAKHIGSVAPSSSSQQKYPYGYVNPRTVKPEMAKMSMVSRTLKSASISG